MSDSSVKIPYSRSICDSDLCASCVHLAYNPGGSSLCIKHGFQEGWPGQPDENDHIVQCSVYEQKNPQDEKLLDELYEMTQIEYDGDRDLTDQESDRYVAIYEDLTGRGVEIPFGVEI